MPCLLEEDDRVGRLAVCELLQLRRDVVIALLCDCSSGA